LKPNEQLADNAFKLFRYLYRAFSLRSTQLTALVGFLIFIAGGVLSPITKVLFIQDLGWSRTDLTDIEGGYGVFLGLFGAIAGGLLADKFGPKRVASFGCIVLAASYAIFGLSSPETGIVPWFDWDDKNIVIGYVLMTTWMEAMIATSMFAMCMTVSWPKVAATQFTAYMAILNLSTATGLKCSGWINDQLSLPMLFILVGGIQLAAIFIFPFIDVHQARNQLGKSNFE
jgi:PAT family beta-lactamase induction signal transducer AmpG